jgi:hypothetical protein
MQLLKKLWKAIKGFFSPTKEDWKKFEKKSRRGQGDIGYGSSGDASDLSDY